MIYVVQRGDSLYKIAAKYGLSLEELHLANPVLNGHTIKVGQEIAIPVPLKTYSVHQNDNLYRIASRFQLPVKQLLSANPQLRTRPLVQGEPILIPEKKTHVINHVQYQELQHTVPYPDEETLLAIKKAQNEFLSIRQTNGISAFERQQQGIISKEAVSSATDFWQIQQALRLQGYLASNVEADWYDKETTKDVDPQKFPNTWEALQKFQQERQLEKWKDHPFFSSLTYSPNRIKPNDLTTWALRYATRYHAQLEDVKSEIYDITFENMCSDPIGKNPLGVVYRGFFHPSFSAEELSELGIVPQKVADLLTILPEKNAFDFIQSHDDALFSFGFVGFSGENLTKLLLTVMLKHPALYQVLFSSFGIDVSYSWSDEKVEKAILTLLVPEAQGDEYVLYGKDALLEIQRNKLLQTAFIRAGLSYEVAKLQVLSAVEQGLI